MCDLTEVDYQKGDVVWVKLGSLWWPGLVHDYDSLPEDIKADTQAFKKKPIAYVKFFQEENFEYVKDIYSIYHYNCLKKTEFIRKGLDMMRSSRVSTSNMQLFPSDVITAENLTQGDPKILERPEFKAEGEAGKAVYEDLFSTPNQKKLKKKKEGKDASPLIGGFLKADPRHKGTSKKTSKNTPKVFCENRLLNLSADAAAKGYQSKDLIQPQDEELSLTTKNYLCVACNYQCTRVNVMMFHYQSHTRHYDHKIKYPAGFKRKKRIGNTPTAGSSKKIKLANGVDDGKKGKTKAEVMELQKQEAEKLKQNFLMDWNEDDNEVEEDLNESVDKSTSKEEEKTSCFDFEDEEEEASSSKNSITFSHRKRLYSKSEDKKNPTNGKESKPELVDEVEALLNETQVPTLPDIPGVKGGDAITLPPPSEAMPEFGSLNSDLNDSLEFRNEVVEKVSSTPANTKATSGKLSKETLKTNFFKKFREEIAEEAKFKEDEEDEAKEEEEFEDEDNCDENDTEKNKQETVPTNHKPDNRPETKSKEAVLKKVKIKSLEVEENTSQADETKVEKQDAQENKTEEMHETVADSEKVKDLEPIITEHINNNEDKPSISQDKLNQEQDITDSNHDTSIKQDIPRKFQNSPIKIQDVPITLQKSPIKLQDLPIKPQESPIKLQDSPIKPQVSPSILRDSPSKLQNVSPGSTQNTIQIMKQDTIPSSKQNSIPRQDPMPKQDTSQIKSQTKVPTSRQNTTSIKKQDVPLNDKQDIAPNKSQAEPSPISSVQNKIDKKAVDQPSIVQIGNQTIHIPIRQNSKSELRKPGDMKTKTEGTGTSKTEEERLSEMMLVVEEVDLSQSPPKYVNKPTQPVVHIDMSPNEKKISLSHQSHVEKRGSVKSIPTIIPIESMRPKYKSINIPSTRQAVTPSEPEVKRTSEQYFILPNNQRIKTPTPSTVKTQTKISLSSPDGRKLSHPQSQVVCVSEVTKQKPSNIPLITLKTTQKKANLPVPGLMKIPSQTSTVESKNTKPSKPQSTLQSKIKKIAHSNATRSESSVKSSGQGSILVNQSTLPSILQQRRITQPARVQPPALVPTPKLVEEPELISEIASIPGADSSDSVVYLINNEHSQQILINNPAPVPGPSTSDNQTYYIDPSSTDLSNIYLTIDDDGNILNIVQKTDEVKSSTAPHSDILAQALADTQVLQAESAVTGPVDVNYAPLVNNTYETSLTLNQAPIMSTSEAPSQVQHTNYYTNSSSVLPLVEIRPNQANVPRGASPEVAYTPSDNFIPT